METTNHSITAQREMLRLVEEDFREGLQGDAEADHPSKHHLDSHPSEARLPCVR